MKKFSLIVPVFNVEKFLERCLKSIILQSYSNFECILIDDGSSDLSSKICDVYSEKDSRFIVIHTKNFGVSHARNIGINKSTGDWIIFIDSDDWIESTLLEKINRSIINETVDIVQWNYSITDGKKVIRISEYAAGKYIATRINKEPTNWGVLWSRAYKKQLLEENNIKFNEDVFFGEDVLFSLKAILLSHEYIRINEKCYNYYMRGDSAIHSVTKEKLMNNVKAIKMLEEFMKEKKLDNDFFMLLEGLKIQTKQHWLFLLENPDVVMWRSVFPEIRFTHLIKSIYGPIYILAFFHFDYIVKLIIKIYRIMKGWISVF